MNTSLKEKLSRAGFASNASYEHIVQCFLEAPNECLRCLNVDGDNGRHKTAFAYALAEVLNNQHILYFEFGLDVPVQPTFVRVVDGEEIVAEPPVAELDKIINEACALSEAEKTVLVLDQLQLADFRQHIRIQSLAKTAVWAYADVTCYANKDNLQLYLVSDGGLSSMLQQVSFRVWLPQRNQAIRHLRSTEVGLAESCDIWLEKLIVLMDELNVSPTLAEYKQLAYDIDTFVHTDYQLKESIIGRIEAVDYARLNSQVFNEVLSSFMRIYENSLYIQESIEIKADLGSL